jgi:hypothetical protein
MLLWYSEEKIEIECALHTFLCSKHGLSYITQTDSTSRNPYFVA